MLNIKVEDLTKVLEMLKTNISVSYLRHTYNYTYSYTRDILTIV